MRAKHAATVRTVRFLLITAFAVSFAGCGPGEGEVTAVDPQAGPSTPSPPPGPPGDATPTIQSGQEPSGDESEQTPGDEPATQPEAAPQVSSQPQDNVAAAPAGAAGTTSWTHWRGPLQNGVAPDRGLPETWSQDGENLVWSQPVACRSCPVALDGRVHAIGVVGDGTETQERVVCFDAESGEILWEHRFNVFLTDIVAARVGWANLAADSETGYVYAHGVQDLLFCFDPDGNVVWSRSLHEEFGSVTGYGGRVHTPVVDEDRLIISFLSSTWGNQGRPLHRYLALDKRTGEVLWWAAPGGQPLDTTYSTPVFVVINGMRLMIAGNADGNVYAMKARTGETVWKFRLSKRGLNTSVVTAGDRVYACHGEENLDSTAMGRLVCIDATGQGDVTDTHEIWRIDGLKAGYASPALHEGRLYVPDESANLFCIDAETGKQLWKHKIGNAGRGSTPVWADGKLYVTENQSFHILRPGDDGCESLDEERFVGQRGVVELWGSPAVANGRVYFGTSEMFYALGITPWNGKVDSLPPPPPEAAADPDAEPAAIHVVPGEVALAPGESATFEVRAYDDGGRFLETVPAEFSVAAGLQGDVSAEGQYQAPEENRGTAGEVQGTVGELTGPARVRVLPDLPFEQDFESYEPGTLPPHWGTSRAKFEIAALDGSKVLRKTNVNPATPVARAEVFIGPPSSTDYTVQADVRGTEVRFHLPEMGLINCRYNLTVLANVEELAITSWDALPRIDESVIYPIEPDTWYRMKLRVEQHEDKAVIRGKIWPREEPEPEEWTVETEDPVPNREGSPGLAAYSSSILEGSPGTEAFFDNVRVEPNQP